MKIKKAPAVFCSLIIIVLSLTSCGYEISIRKKEDIGEDVKTTTIVIEEGIDQADQPIILPDVATTSYANGSQNGIQVDTSYQALAMSSQDVIEFYKRATEDVKIRAPGYVRSEHHEISDVTGGDGSVQLVDRILNLVATEILKDSGDEESVITIMPHDDLAVMATFPLFNKPVGCELTDMSIVKSATCYSDGSTYKIVIVFDDILNPDHETSSFADIMNPVDRDALSDPIEEYLVVLDMNSYKFDINYTNCEITCIVDKETSRMTSLKHKMIMDIDIVMNLDLILFQTNNVKASGTIVNFMEYHSFDWS